MVQRVSFGLVLRFFHFEKLVKEHLINKLVFWIERVFGCVVASAFEVIIATRSFGNVFTADFYWWGLPLIGVRA